MVLGQGLRLHCLFLFCFRAVLGALLLFFVSALFFTSRVQVPAWAEANKPRVNEFLQLLDGELGKRRYITGENFSVADITGLVALDFMKPAKLSIPENLANVKRWHAELSARPSASA